MRKSPPRHAMVAAAFAISIVILGTGTAAVAVTSTPVPPESGSAAEAVGGGSHYYADSNIDISEDIDGDVYAAGQSITISGDITGDVMAAAQTITITGTVDGDVRLAAQSITLSGDVSRSGTVAAADVTVSDGGSLGGDLVGAAGVVTIAGGVGRDATLSTGRLTVDGTVGGDLVYTSDTEAQIAPGAVAGSVDRTAMRQSEDVDVDVSPFAAFVGWFLGLLYALVALSLATLAAGLLVPRWLQRVTDRLVPTPWKALLVGFVASVAVPAVLLFLLVTIIGAPLALAGGVVWFAMTLATFPFGAYYLGRLVFRRPRRPVVLALVGGVILIVALQIPWLQVVVWLAMVFFGLGAQLLELYARRPWAVQTRAEDAGPPDLLPTRDDEVVLPVV